jgi:hypothetical protein
LTRQAGWGLAATSALLGILLGAQRLTRAAGLAGQALAEAVRLVLGAGWLLLLLVAGGLVLGSAAVAAGQLADGCGLQSYAQAPS